MYELNLHYPTAKYSSDILMMDWEKDFVNVRARLYLGASYEFSPKRAQAHKQGKLAELDKVEARDEGEGSARLRDRN